MIKEKTFIDLALRHKREYENTPWWKFKKRANEKKAWKAALRCVIKYEGQ